MMALLAGTTVVLPPEGDSQGFGSPSDTGELLAAPLGRARSQGFGGAVLPATQLIKTYFRQGTRNLALELRKYHAQVAYVPDIATILTHQEPEISLETQTK